MAAVADYTYRLFCIFELRKFVVCYQLRAPIRMVMQHNERMQSCGCACADVLEDGQLHLDKIFLSSLVFDLLRVRLQYITNTNAAFACCPSHLGSSLLPLSWCSCSSRILFPSSVARIDKCSCMLVHSPRSQGIQYVHASALGAHGDLRSSKCLVDGRWRLKIGGLALPSELAAPFPTSSTLCERDAQSTPAHSIQNPSLQWSLFYCWVQFIKLSPGIHYSRAVQSMAHEPRGAL